jgi:CubicO group peptidase (beta-lactamase class C family)
MHSSGGSQRRTEGAPQSAQQSQGGNPMIPIPSSGAPWLRAGLGAAAMLFAGVAAAEPLPSADPQAAGMSAERLDRINQVFQREIDAGALPGAVIMVARGGRLVHAATLGVQDPATGEPMAEDSIFRIYSMTKPIVSVAAMMLMEDGALQLTDPVSKFLPEFAEMQVSAPIANAYGRVSYRLEPVASPMTVQDLLRHTAGLGYGELTGNSQVRDAYAAAGAFNPDGMAFDARAASADDQIAGLARAPLVHQPGRVWEYSLASDVLGRVVERASGQRLSDFLEERLFGPLGMQATAFHVPENAMGRLAQTFEAGPDGAPLEMIDVSAAPGNDSGGAGAVSTAGDYLRFTQMLLNGGELDGVRVLSPTSVKLMTADHLGDRIATPVTPGELLMGVPGYSFGLGVMVRQADGIAGVPGSEGEFMWAGYGGTFFWADPEEEIAAVLMTQMPGATRAYYRRMVKQMVHQAVVGDPAPEQIGQ